MTNLNRSSITSLAVFLATMVTGCVTPTDDVVLEETALPEEIAADEEAESTSQGLLGADACKDTEIIITNSRTRDGYDTDIFVQRVEYFSASEGKWYTEDLGDELIEFGSSHTWWNQNLAHAENDLLTDWKVFYKFLDGGWSSLVFQQIDTPNDVCLANDNYAMTVQ